MDNDIAIYCGSGPDYEVDEMNNFVRIVEQRSLTPFVVSLCYEDSSCCTIVLADNVEQFSPIANELFQIALETISQFEWFGYVQWGKPMDDRLLAIAEADEQAEEENDDSNWMLDDECAQFTPQELLESNHTAKKIIGSLMKKH